VPTKFTFDAEKALEALVYIVSKSKADLYGSLKILYRADKMHLHRYGRFVAGDFYKRLEHGPVPQGAYDILHFVRGDHSSSPVPEARQALRFVDKTHFQALRPADTDALSDTDRECLDEAIAVGSRKSFGQHKRETHDAAYEATGPNQEMSVETIASMARDGRETLLQYLADPYPDKGS
jgi:hypothetical protein